MAAKPTSGQYKLKLTGPGIAIDRPVTEDIANRIINLAMVGVTGDQQTTSLGNFVAPLATASPNQQPPKGATAKQFMALKRPGNFYQRVACLAYYLTHYQNTPTFKTKDISELNTQAAEPRFTNAAAFVRDATSKYRYLSQAGGSKKQITTFGETIVDALPDQEKARALHAERPARGGRKSSARKKKKSG